MKRTVDALTVAATHGHVGQVTGAKWEIRQLEGGAPVADDVPAFAHPLVLQQDHAAVNVVVDVRGYGKYEAHQALFHVRNAIGYTLAHYRAKLNYVWVTEAPAILRDISPLPMQAFASWISENVSRRWGLDPQEQFKVAVLAAIFYNSQFTDNATPEEREKMALVNAVARNLRCQMQDVLDVVDQVPYIADVAEFCQRCALVTGSVRLQEMNAGVLFAILGGTWFDPNAKEMVAVALEHPPTWISILLHAVTERSVKNSAIAKMIERPSFRNEGQNFVRSVQNMLRSLAAA
jgi:hypothetical protein